MKYLDSTQNPKRYASSASFIAALSLVAVALCQREDQLSSATGTNEAANFPGRSLLGTALVFTRGNSTLTYDSDNAEVSCSKPCVMSTIICISSFGSVITSAIS